MGSQAGWHLEVPISKDGLFAFPQIAGGDYVLQASLTSGAYVEQIAGRNTNVLHLNSAVSEEGLAVTLGTTVTSVEGKVDSGDVIKDKTGVLFENLTTGNVVLVYPEQDGRFAVNHLPPGSYRVFAWTDVTQIEYRNAAELARQKKNSVVIDLANDSHLTNVELSLIPSGM